MVLAALLLLTSGCAASGTTGTKAGSGAPKPSSAFPVTVRAANGSVTLSERPERIVSLSPTATEMLFAIGAGPQVVAVDSLSNYPPAAPVTDLSAYKPNVEAISKFEPDLVVLSFDPGSVIGSLGALDIPVMNQPAAEALSGTYDQIRQLGMATGHPAQATTLIDSMRSQIQQIVGSFPAFPTPPTYYHELDPTYFTATSKTFIGQLYTLLGLQNIADRAPKAASGYIQLSAEYIIQADPRLVFLADTRCCKQSAATVAKRPGWNRIAAVKDGAVVGLDDDVASRWGPRVVDFLRVVAQRVTAALAAAA